MDTLPPTLLDTWPPDACRRERRRETTKKAEATSLPTKRATVGSTAHPRTCRVAAPIPPYHLARVAASISPPPSLCFPGTTPPKDNDERGSSGEKWFTFFSSHVEASMRSLRRSQHVFGRSSFGRVSCRIVVVTSDKTEERERGREGEKEQNRASDYRKSSVRRLIFPFLRCLKPQSVPRPLPLHGWRHRRKKGVSFPSAPHYYDCFRALIASLSVNNDLSSLVIWVDRHAADEDEVDVEIEGFELRRLENGVRSMSSSSAAAERFQDSVFLVSCYACKASLHGDLWWRALPRERFPGYSVHPLQLLCCFALPYQVMLSEKVQNEVRAVIVKEQEAQPLNIEKHNPEIQGIDLNRTPQQKPKRKMHRPKVIQEGKPSGAPKPRTPKLVTSKVAKMNEEGSTGKRKYVRKKIVLSSSDASSSMLVDNVVPDGTNRGESVRQCLNFDSESMGARDACPGAAIAFKHCARLQTLDSCLHSTMQPDLQSQAMIENPGSGMTIDLDGSMNQMPYECVSYSEKPNPNFQPRRAEEMTTNQILNLCGSMPDKFVPQRENLNEISKNNNYIANTTTADRSHKTGKLSDSVGISIMILKGTKRDHNVVQDAPISDYTEFMHTVGGISQLSESHCMSDHDLFLPTRSEKKRTGNK
ncbi:hypothetical protein BHM03_00053978 [Ensete ventricosum]|nr:hypothetical protein BHM03_00053978 [Ensete ventricosum]